LVLLLTTC